ncbi:MAG: HEAT repeat domain-containing protein [Gammaproteobacteria bacterium]
MMKKALVSGFGVFCLLVAGSLDAGITVIRTETQHFAIIISYEDGGPSAELANVLREQYGFKVAALMGLDANLRNIENILYELAREIGPYDQVFIHIALPVSRVPELFYLPAGSSPEDRWKHLPWIMLQKWLASVETGPLLLTFPGCATSSRSPYGDIDLQELAYQIGKRRFPVEVMMVCDLESLRTRRRDPEARFVDWRGEQVSGMLASLLSGAVNTRSIDVLDVETLNGAALVDALGQYEDEGLRLNYLTIPLHQEGIFRFVPLETGNAYETRFANAGSYEALIEIQRDYLGASSEAEALQAPFIAFSRKVALSPRAAAPPMLDLRPSEILQLRRNAGWALMLRSEDLAARDAIVDIVQEADSSVLRRTAVVNLSKMGENARPVEIQALKQAVEDEDPFVRDAAVVALAETRAPETPDFLAAAFPNESDPRVKRSLLLTLSNFGRQQDAPLFMDAMEDQDPGVRSQAVAALSALPPSAAINQALIGQLGADNDAGVRTTIAYALSQTAPAADRSGNIEILMAGLLSDDAPEVRVAMAKSLGQLGGGDAENALRATLAGDNPASVRIACARALGVMASPAAVPELEAAANSEDPMLRVAAIEALGRIGTEPAADVIWMKLEQDEDLRVQQAALESLESMPVDPASIRERLDSPSVQVRQAAVAQVANSDDPATSNLLLEALEDRDNTVQQTSIAGLSRRPLAANPETVRDVLESGNTQTQVNLINVLGRMPRDEAPWVEEPLVQASNSDSPEVRAAAIRALGSGGDPQQLEAILVASEDPYALVRESAARALGNFDAEPATIRLEQLAKQDRDEGVRRAAIEALSGPLSKKLYRR